MPSRKPFRVEVFRGPVVESFHDVLAVVVDEKGQLVHSWGHPGFVTMPRSSIKMLQALPLIESGALAHYDLNDKQLALACSSHRGQKEHLAVLREWMQKVPLQESQFACGAHYPSHEASMQEVVRRNEKATALMNNCSGKHAGLLTTCVHLKEKTEGYEKPEHSSQKRLRKVLSETMRIDHEKLPFGIDGCSIVTYGVPLQNIAIGLSALLNPKESAVRRDAAQRILKAVTAEPFYLSGSDDFTTVVNEKTQGRSIVKVGAEGVFAGLLPEKGFAFAVKAADGAKRAAEFVTAHLLMTLGGLTEAEVSALKSWTHPTITTWKGETAGQIRLAP